MPTFTPVDHDPFADDAPAPSAPSSAAPISFSDAPSGGGGGPVFLPVDHDPFSDSSDTSGARPLTIRGGRSAPRPTLSTPIGGAASVLGSSFSPPRNSAPTASAAPAADASAPADDGSMTYDQAFPSPTPHPGGALSNSQDDGYASGAAKGTATGIIKGVGQAVGAYGGLSGLADYMIARAESAYTGKPVDQVMAEHDATRKRVQADMAKSPLGRLALATDPANVLPAPDDVSGPILAKTGEYVPTSEPGKLAQAGVEAAVGAFGPGGGMISPGTAGRAVAGALARQAPTMAAAGSIGQGVTDYTGDPLLGLGAGLVGAPLAEAGLSKAGSALAPVVGGSKLLNAAPVIGPAIQRARGNEVARTILGQADDPAAVRAAVAQPAPDPAIPNSPQTFAGQIGNDQGLFEAEKALRNTKAEKPIDPATGQASAGPTYFNAVDRGQSAAQMAALQGIQPTGDVMLPGQILSARMDAVNSAAEDAIDRLTAAHNDAVAGRASSGQAFADGMRADLAARQADRVQAGADFIGQQRADLADRTIARGQASGDAKADADAARQADHDALVQRLGDALQAQRGQAMAAAAPLAGGQVDMNDLGATLRSSVDQIRADTKSIHRDLYAQVDPHGSLALVASPIGDRASAIATDLASKGGEMGSAEASLFNRAANLPDVASYGMVHQLDTDISAAMSAERRNIGESPTWARLAQLKSAVKSAITDATDNHSAWEQRQVAAGAMAPEDTIAARLAGGIDEYRAGQQTVARANTGTDGGGGFAPRTSPASGFSGAEVSEGGRLGGTPRDPGLSGPGGDAAPQGPGGVDPLPNAPAASPLRGRDPLTDGIRARTGDAEAALKQAFGEERGGKLAANPLQAIGWLNNPGEADNLFRLPRQREAIRAYGEAAQDARTAYFSDRQAALRQQYEENDRNPSPLDRRVTPEEADGLKTGPDDGEIRQGPDGQHYLLSKVENNPFTGTQTTRWVPLGEHASLHDLVATHAAISGARADTPLGASARAMGAIFDRMGVGKVPTYTMPEGDFAKATGNGSAGGFFFPGRNAIFVKEGGTPAQQLHVAVHEGAHAAFFHALNKDPEVAAGVDAMLAHAKAWRGKIPQEDGAFSNTYGLTNRDEYVSEAFSNPKFQKFLSQVPVTSGLLKTLNLGAPAGAMRSLWDAFLGSIHKAFGIGFDPNSMSLLEATVRYGDRISSAAERTPRTLDGLLGRGDEPSALPSHDGPDDPRFDAPGFDPDGTPRAPQRPDVSRPQDLRAFVRSRGGMIDTGGDFASMGLHELIGKGARAVDPDRMREAAAEAGYLGADTARAMRETTPNDLLDALSGDRPVHSVRDEGAAAAWAAHDEARERYDAARGEFGTRSRPGGQRDPAPLDSYGRDDIEGPNGPQMREPASSGLAPTFDREAESRLRRANLAYAEYAKTYKNPIVGPGLRTTGYAGQYQRSDAAFIKAAIKPGADGYANARAFLTAAKNDPDAVAAMHDAVLNPLRKAVTGNGTLPPRELANWKSADGYGPALRALDEVTPNFSARFDDAGKAGQALVDLGLAHDAEIKAAQGEAARQAIVANVARKAQLGQETADDRAMVARMVADRRASDRAAGQADRAGVASAIADRAASDRFADAQSRAEMQAGVSAAKGIRDAAKATPAGQFARKAGGAIASEEVENAVASFLKTGTGGAARMRGLVQSVANEPDALAGLRKAGTDWLVRNHTGADGMLKGGDLIRFMRDNRATLSELYPSAQVSMMAAVARDVDLGTRWRTSTAVKGGSDSAKNLLAVLDKVGKGDGGHAPTVGLIAAEALGYGLERLDSVGWKAAGLAAMGAGVAYMGNTLRQAGIRNTANLYREAMANPELARALISKMPTAADGSALHNLARVLRRGLIVGPMLPGQGGERQGAAGPR